MSRTNRNSVTVRVPAKVNLQLAVGPREVDGFHNLVTVFQAISIYDDLTITHATPGSGLSLSITGDHIAGVPADETNLAAKAADYAQQQENYYYSNNKSLKGFKYVPSNPFGN